MKKKTEREGTEAKLMEPERGDTGRYGWSGISHNDWVLDGSDMYSLPGRDDTLCLKLERLHVLSLWRCVCCRRSLET